MALNEGAVQLMSSKALEIIKKLLNIMEFLCQQTVQLIIQYYAI